MNASANRGHAESGMDGDATAFTSGTMRFADHATLVTTEVYKRAWDFNSYKCHKRLFFKRSLILTQITTRTSESLKILPKLPINEPL